MNNLNVIPLDLPGTYHGIHEKPVYLQKKSLQENIVCQKKNRL